MEKTPMGIPVLDDALGGGIPRGYVILLEVDTGTRLDAIITNYLATGLKKGELAYILCTEYPLQFPYQQLRQKNINVDKALEEKQLVGIDAFTDAFGWGEFEPQSEYSIHDLTNSRHVHDILRKAVLALKPKDNLRGVVDSLTAILHAAREEDEAINYVHHQMSAQKNHGNILIYTIAREAHSEEVIRRLEHIVDGVITLYKIYTDEGWNIAIQIEKMRGIDFKPQLLHYQVKDGEIILTPFDEIENEKDEESEEELAKEFEQPRLLEEPSEPEMTPPEILPVPQTEEPPEPELESQTEDEQPLKEPIIFDEPKNTEEREEKLPTDTEDDEKDTFFF